LVDSVRGAEQYIFLNIVGDSFAEEMFRSLSKEPQMARSRPFSCLLSCAVLALALGCAGNPQPTGTSVIVDPTASRSEVGGTDDVFQVCQKMINSMRRDPQVAAMASKIILLDQNGIIIDPKLTDYNARMLYNELKSKLNRAAGDEFQFLDRQAVALERSRQLGGEVKTSGIDTATAGADMTLTIELIAMQSATTTTVQYNFKLTRTKDGIELWSDNDTIVKRT